MDGNFVPSPKDPAADPVGNVDLLVFCGADDTGRFKIEAGIVLGHNRLVPSSFLEFACGTNAARNDGVRKNLPSPRGSERRGLLGFRKCLVERNLRNRRERRRRGLWEAIRG